MSDEVDDDGDTAFDMGVTANDVGGDDDDGSEDSFEAQANVAGALNVTAPRAQRTISDKTRQLYREAAAKIAAQRAADPDALDDDYVPAIEPEPDKNTAPVAAATSPAAAVPPSSTAATPPAPSLDPEVTKLRDEWNAKHAELAEREKRITEAERSGDFGKLRELYLDKMSPAVFEMVKKWEGIDDPEQLKDVIADLVTDLSVNYLGVEVPSEVKQRLENRRAVKSVKAMKAALSESEKARDAKLAADALKAQREGVSMALNRAMSEAQHIEKFPYLAAEEHPGSLILDVYESVKRKDGTELHWEEAAKRANEFLAKQASAWFDKRKHLLAKAEPQATVANGKPSAQQGDHQVRRSSPQSPPQPPVTANNGKWDAEAHRRQTKAKFRQVFARENAED